MEKEILKSMQDSLRHAQESLKQGHKQVDKMLRSLDPKEQARFKQFFKKYLKLTQQGKLAEAKELEQKFRDGQ